MLASIVRRGGHWRAAGAADQQQKRQGSEDEVVVVGDHCGLAGDFLVKRGDPGGVDQVLSSQNVSNRTTS